MSIKFTGFTVAISEVGADNFRINAYVGSNSIMSLLPKQCLPDMAGAILDAVQHGSASRLPDFKDRLVALTLTPDV